MGVTHVMSALPYDVVIRASPPLPLWFGTQPPPAPNGLVWCWTPFGFRLAMLNDLAWCSTPFDAQLAAPNGLVWCSPPLVPCSMMGACGQEEVQGVISGIDKVISDIDMRDNVEISKEVAEVIFGEKTDKELEEEAELLCKRCEAELDILLTDASDARGTLDDMLAMSVGALGDYSREEETPPWHHVEPIEQMFGPF